MLFNASLQLGPDFANVTRIGTCTGKLVNNIALKIFTDRVLHLKKFSGENSTTILMFLHYLSQI